MAHYHMGGIRADGEMVTRVPGLYAAGEAVGGANGANRLSGNAITEAFVFGERAGRSAARAAKRVRQVWDEKRAGATIEHNRRWQSQRAKHGATPIRLQTELQKLMWKKAGPFRSGEELVAALARIREMKEQEVPGLSVGKQDSYNLDLQDWYELRAMLTTAEAVVSSALTRTESRGAHQREDFPDLDPAFAKNQVLDLKGGRIISSWASPVRCTRPEPGDE